MTFYLVEWDGQYSGYTVISGGRWKVLVVAGEGNCVVRDLGFGEIVWEMIGPGEVRSAGPTFVAIVRQIHRLVSSCV